GGVGLVATESVVVSPGWKYLATAVQGDNALELIVREFATGKEVHRINGGPMALAFSADEKTLAWAPHTEGPEAHVVVWDLTAGKEVVRLKSSGFNGSPRSMDEATAIALSADGRSLAVSWMSRVIEIWDLKTGKQILPLGKFSHAHYNQFSTDWLNLLVRPALAFSPDGKRLVGSLA